MVMSGNERRWGKWGSSKQGGVEGGPRAVGEAVVMLGDLEDWSGSWWTDRRGRQSHRWGNYWESSESVEPESIDLEEKLMGELGWSAPTVAVGEDSWRWCFFLIYFFLLFSVFFPSHFFGYFPPFFTDFFFFLNRNQKLTVENGRKIIKIGSFSHTKIDYGRKI